jgi:NADPH:quinone reductase-like Zn-dependent oxidoreductase
MKAARIHRFGPPDVIVYEDVARPTPGNGQVVVRVKAAGVGPWDAWVRAGKSALLQPLSLILGSDVSGVVDALGSGVANLRAGDEVYGVTDAQFTGAYAEYALATATMIAPKPKTLKHIQAASVPVVAVTAWQMLFDYAQVATGQTVLIHSAAGNVGAYAVQLAKLHGLHIAATAAAHDVEYVQHLGAHEVIDLRSTRFEAVVQGVDAVVDTVGGEIRQRSYGVLKPGGMLISSGSEPDQELARQHDVRALFFLVKVTTEALNSVTALLDAGKLKTTVGKVPSLAEVRSAHEMVDGKPHKRGKIVLKVAD